MIKKSLLRKLKAVPRDCPFCQGKNILDYKDAEGLKKYITERGKILGKDRSGLCSKHQRQLTREIKRARFIALLPFTVHLK